MRKQTKKVLNRLKKNSQKRMIVEYLIENGSITRKQSVDDLFIFNLPARMSELEEMGLEIRRIPIKGVLRSGFHWHGLRWELL